VFLWGPSRLQQPPCGEQLSEVGQVFSVVPHAAEERGTWVVGKLPFLHGAVVERQNEILVGDLLNAPYADPL